MLVWLLLFFFVEIKADDILLLTTNGMLVWLLVLFLVEIKADDILLLITK